MPSLTLPVKTSFVLSWTLTDAQDQPINNADVIATLYAGRSLTNPDAAPGEATPPIIGLVLPYVAASAGVYSATVPATLGPLPDGTGYILVIDATITGSPIYHAEQPVVIDTAGSAMDLTTVDLVKNWLPGSSDSTDDDATIQLCITAWGFEFLRRTGMGDQSGDFTQSPFTAICAWDETYDGCGTNRLPLRNRPIKSVTSLVVNGLSVPASSGYPSHGYVIDGSKRSISMRAPFLGWGAQLWSSWQSGPYHAFARGPGFPYDFQNIHVQYTAGYAVTPADIVQCANQVVGLNYKRRTWIGEKSRAVAGGGGSITWGDWDVPPEAQSVISMYTRTL
jgi:hypothetical protein